MNKKPWTIFESLPCYEVQSIENAYTKFLDYYYTNSSQSFSIDCVTLRFTIRIHPRVAVGELNRQI